MFWKGLYSVASEIYGKTEDDAYLAPEIFFEPHDAGPAADVYAAGVVFYELFTGEKIFASLKDAVEVECRFAEPPSQKTADLPPGFDRWLQSLCALRPADRPDARVALEQFGNLFVPAAKSATLRGEDVGAPAEIDYNNLPSGYALTHNYIVERRLGKPGSLTFLTAEHMASLNPGEAYVWSSKATDTAFSRGTVKITCRPRVTRHGGATRTAI